MRALTFALAAAMLAAATVQPASAAPATPLRGAGAMFPGTAYQNQHQIPGSHGSIRVSQPQGATGPLKLQMQMSGLLPKKTYIVFLDKNGTTPTGNHSFGPWVQIGQFISNAAGNASYQYRAAPGSIPAGAHSWAVFVNRADAGVTVLISDNFSFTQP